MRVKQRGWGCMQFYHSLFLFSERIDIMSRLSRKSLFSNVIHVMIQGINKEFIFNEADDIKKYLYYIFKYKEDFNIELIAYCMMNNHAHFLVHIQNIDDLSRYIKKCNESFVYYYNKKYNRVGVLFRNRYQSEDVCDDLYVLNCINYIHDNPVKAKMVNCAKDYPFSSCKEYIEGTGISQNTVIKRICNNTYNFERIDQNSFIRPFIDTEEDKALISYNSKIEFGISEFLTKNNLQLIHVLSKTTYLKSLFEFLINQYKINIKDILEYFNISKYFLNKVLQK